jgi:hypothetical protein
VAKLRQGQRKLLVVDVSEPANLDIDAYATCRNDVVRQDAGNAFAPDLHYVLGPISWKMIMLSKGTVFGCFAEAMALFHSIHHNGEVALAERDWFQVDSDGMETLEALFADIGFTVPYPRCFGRPVLGFDLSLERQAEFQVRGISTPNVLPQPGLD